MKEFIDRVYAFLSDKKNLNFIRDSCQYKYYSDIIINLLLESEQFEYHHNLEFIQHLLCIICNHNCNSMYLSGKNVFKTDSYVNFRKKFKLNDTKINNVNNLYYIITKLKEYDPYDNFKDIIPISSLSSNLTYLLKIELTTILINNNNYYAENMDKLKISLLNINSEDLKVLFYDCKWKIILYKLLTFEFNMQQLQTLSKNEMLDIFFESINYGHDEIKERLKILSFMKSSEIDAEKHPLLMELKVLIDEHIQFINNHCKYRLNSQGYLDAKEHFIKIE